MKEEVLHYVWKQKYFELKGLETTEGAPLEILNFGSHNKNSGPDFLNAEVIIEGTKWCGHIEVHINSSSWYQHKHDEDPNYESVILHVVWKEDKKIKIEGNKSLPCLALENRISTVLIEKFKKLAENKEQIPCFPFVNSIHREIIDREIQSMMLKRLEGKVKLVEDMLDKTCFDWESVFYQMLAKNMGFHVNSDAFLDLAQRTPLKIVRKYKSSLFQLEALLFGQAGLLPSEKVDDYVAELKSAYAFLKHKHGLVAMRGHQWNFLRLRPANFPTIRIAQFAKIIFQTHHLFSKTIALKEVQEGLNMLAVQPGPYWQRHYVFGKRGKVSQRKMGKKAGQLIIVNTICPILFTFGKLRSQKELIERAVQFLGNLPPEKNSILQQWKEVGVNPISALESQGLLGLWREKCQKKLCMECQIGERILI